MPESTGNPWMFMLMMAIAVFLGGGVYWLRQRREQKRAAADRAAAVARKKRPRKKRPRKKQ